MSLNVGGISSSQLDSDFEVIMVDDDSKSDRTAREIFGQYPKLIELKEIYSKKIIELKAQEKEMGNRWMVYLYKQYKNSDTTCHRLSVIAIPITGFPVVGISLAIDIKYLLLLPPTFFISAALGYCALGCAKKQSRAYDAIKKELSKATKKANEIAMWINLARSLTEFNLEWSKYSSGENTESIFKKLDAMLSNNKNDFSKIDGGRFKNLALMLLMEKVCSLQPDSKFARLWNGVMVNPVLWQGKTANKVWEQVGLNNQQDQIYLEFYQYKRGKVTEIGDPQQWCGWLDNIIKGYINNNFTNELTTELNYEC